MIDLPILFITIVYLLVCVIFALIWYIYSQHENMYFERQDNVQERKAYIGFIETLQQAAAVERKDLYDRLQSGTLPQYKQLADDPNEIEDDTDEGIVAMEDAKDELMGVDNG